MDQQTMDIKRQDIKKLIRQCNKIKKIICRFDDNDDIFNKENAYQYKELFDNSDFEFSNNGDLVLSSDGKIQIKLIFKDNYKYRFSNKDTKRIMAGHAKEVMTRKQTEKRENWNKLLKSFKEDV